MDKYAALEIYDHPDDGLCWTWKDVSGRNCICSMTTVEKSIYADVLSIRAELSRANETIEVVAEQRNRALEALEKAARDFVSANGTRPEWWTNILDLYHDKCSIAATDPATVEPEEERP